MDYSIDSVKKNIEEISSNIKQQLDSQPGSMNIIELMNRNHLENQHSNVIAYLIDPLEGHKHEEYGRMFIRLLNKHFEKQIDENILVVRREDPTSEKRRIDILIKTETSFIIIENKIYAEDQPAQMIDYINDIQGRDEEGDKERNIFCVYLTPSKKEISKDSLSEDEKKEISKYGGFINITYKDDILPWIDSLTVRNDEQVLKAALTQYKDILEGITGKRKITDRKKLFNTEIVKRYFNKDNKSELMNLHKRFQELMSDNEYEKWFVEESLRLPIYMNFILEVVNQTMNYPKEFNQFKLFCKDCSFSIDEIDNWADFVSKEQMDFGLEWQSPDPDVKMFFMFRNAGNTSACCGYKHTKPITNEDFIYINKGTAIFTENIVLEPLEYVNKQLLQIWEYKENLANIVATNVFLKRLNSMKGKWITK